MSASAPDRGDGDGPDVYNSYNSDHGGPKPTAQESEGMTRRGLFRKTAVVGGTLVTLGAGSSAVPRYSPVGRAAAIAPAIPIGIAAGAAAIAYLSGTDLFTGDDRDYSGYTGATALHDEIYIGAKDMASTDERVMTSIENNITHSEAVAMTKGKKAIIEEMNAGNGETAAQTAMEAAIDEYYASIQKNILTHYNEQVRKIVHHYKQLDAHADIMPSEVIVAGYTDTYTDDGQVSDQTYQDAGIGDKTAAATLLNGETFDVEVRIWNYTGSTGSHIPTILPWTDDFSTTGSVPTHPLNLDWNPGTLTIWQNGDDYWSWDYKARETTDTVTWMSNNGTPRMVDAWDSLHASRDTVLADLSGFVSDVYAQYSAGDIPTEDLVDPVTAATELRQNYDNKSGQSAHAALMGIPTTADLTADLEIVSDSAEDGIWEVTADLFTSYVPTEDVAASASISSGVLTLDHQPVADSTYELTTGDAETVEFPSSDLSDNGDGTWQVDLSADLTTTTTSVTTLLEEVGFKTGNTYQPSNWSEPFFIAYNYIDGATGEEKGDFTQIESEFTVVEVTDSNGDSVDSFRTESRNQQTADVSALKAELEQLREEQIALQEEAQNETDGGSNIVDDIADSQAGPLVGAFLFVMGILGVGKILDS